MVSYCPFCGSRNTGRISRERYFCRECCHEWIRENGKVVIYEIASDGTAVRLQTVNILVARENLVRRKVV